MKELIKYFMPELVKVSFFILIMLICLLYGSQASTDSLPGVIKLVITKVNLN